MPYRPIRPTQIWIFLQITILGCPFPLFYHFKITFAIVQISLRRKIKVFDLRFFINTFAKGKSFPTIFFVFVFPIKQLWDGTKDNTNA